MRRSGTPDHLVADAGAAIGQSATHEVLCDAVFTGICGIEVVTKTLVSRKASALIHLFPRELAANVQPAPKRRHHLVIAMHARLRLGVVGQPLPELFVQGGVLGASSLTGGLNELLVSAEGDVLHGSSVHGIRVHGDQGCAWPIPSRVGQSFSVDLREPCRSTTT
jgi:hypothetical protein